MDIEGQYAPTKIMRVTKRENVDEICTINCSWSIDCHFLRITCGKSQIFNYGMCVQQRDILENSHQALLYKYSQFYVHAWELEEYVSRIINICWEKLGALLDLLVMAPMYSVVVGRRKSGIVWIFTLLNQHYKIVSTLRNDEGHRFANDFRSYVKRWV